MHRAEVMDILNIADIADVSNITDIASRHRKYCKYRGYCSIVIGLWLLSRWKRVVICKVSRGSPVTVPPFKLKLLRDVVIVVLGRVYRSLLRLI